MYSVFVSKIKAMALINDDLRRLIKRDANAVVLPWSMPQELDANRLLNDYFKKGSDKYNKYINSLINLGIREENIFIGNCYSDSKELLREKIKKADVLLLTGGNPEMLFSKVMHGTELLYDIKYFEGIVIGESAGAVLEFKRYFITKENNYYKYFAFYDGFGIVDDPFYIDVHSLDTKEYLNFLREVANEYDKDIYAIADDGAVVLNRSSLDVKTYGNVIKIERGIV